MFTVWHYGRLGWINQISSNVWSWM